MKRILRYLAYSLLVLGGISWFTAFVPIPWTGSDFEMPLGDLEGVAVDSSGHIYCGVQFYSRIQKYGPDGHFIWSIHIGASGGAFRIRVNRNDEIEVATARNDRFYRFSSKGDLIEQRENVHHFFADFGDEGDKQCRGPDGSIYQIRSALLFPHVVRITPAGQETTVVSVPIYKWFIMGPLPGWFFWMIAIFILSGLARHEKREQKNEEPRLITPVDES
jgi:hypothetical protein